MLRAFAIAALALGGAASLWPAGGAATPPGQAQVVDRIVARIEGDIITLSEVRELGAYQQLVQGRSEPDGALLAALIEQWVTQSEADAAQFPPASRAEVERQTGAIAARFPSPAAYSERLAALGLTPQAVERMVARQLRLTGYLDYKFRPAVIVEDEMVVQYYEEQLRPALAAKGQAVPELDAVRDQIRELLIAEGINQRTAAWLEETKARLRIEIEPAARAWPGAKS